MVTPRSRRSRARSLDDPVDPKVASNTRGKLICHGGSEHLHHAALHQLRRSQQPPDSMGFPPIGEVIEGMNVVDSLHTAMARAPRGRGRPRTGRSQGQRLPEADFQLDYIKKATLLRVLLGLAAAIDAEVTGRSEARRGRAL